MMKDKNITMTFLIRNEEDIIEQNIRFHHDQGVDNFIVMDNLSTDKTADIIKDLSKEIDIEYIYQTQDNYSQSEWVTEMARRACTQCGADWVINSDADEFWIATSGSLQNLIAVTPEDVGVLYLNRHNAVLCWSKGDKELVTSHPENSVIFEYNSVNNINRPLPGKCMHRASRSVLVSQGNHSVAGVEGNILKTEGNAYILHYPYRSLEQYKKKIRFGGAAYSRNTTLPKSVGSTWREHYKVLNSSALDHFWGEMCRRPSDIMISLQEGATFKNNTVVDFLKRQRDLEDRERLRESVDLLLLQTRKRFDDLLVSQAGLLMQFSESERKNRPLYYNIEFCLNGPQRHLERVAELHSQESCSSLCRNFGVLRDIFSLFPQNENFVNFLSHLLEVSNPDDVRRLRDDCDGRVVVLHISCSPRIDLAERSIASFDAVKIDYHHIIIVGCTGFKTEDDVELSLRYDGRTINVPVPDNYESLHRKLFYALTLVHLVANPRCVIKVDDNLILKDAEKFAEAISPVLNGNVEYIGREVGSTYHQQQWHGWHITKCDNHVIEERGYQYPLPRRYAAGGYGYALGRGGIKACAYMYLAMKEFFSMRAVGLEDAYIGHAMYAAGIELHNVASEYYIMAFPGLSSTELD